VRLHPSRLLLALALFLGSLAAFAATAQATVPAPQYYVALGDSLSQGYMPPAGNSDQGYVDDLYASLHATDPSLQLVKLGCSGETTTTMINGGICSYGGADSQLAAAAQFLSAHRGQVAYLTLDIGANDVDNCVSGTSLDPACIEAGIATIAQNLPRILATITAADPGARHRVGMTYYDPFLAAYLAGPTGPALAKESLTASNVLNQVETAAYRGYGLRVAKVDQAFRSHDAAPVTVPGLGTLPTNVATICELTYMCTVQNIHPNVTGYQLIAKTFAAKL
jgi:lysophospholipase L1-like esterase